MKTQSGHMGKGRCRAGIEVWVILALVFSSWVWLWGCAAKTPEVYVKDGKEYGRVQGSFRHKWWNYYERALSLMEGGYYTEALEDLKKASSQRFSDQRTARTYGMHFVDYFPHREAGLIYYLTGDYDAAWEELQLSIRHEPSAKARHYIDKIRKIRMELEKQPVATPRLWLNPPSNEIWTRDVPFVVSGTAEDNQFVSRIMLAGEQLLMEGAQQKVSFEKALTLAQGTHRIDVSAENLMGGFSRKEIVVHVDRQSPIVSLASNAEEIRASSCIRGFVSDESGEVFLSVNGLAVFVPKGREAPFSAIVAPDATEVLIEARDRLGNETRARLDLQNEPAAADRGLLAFSDSPSIADDSGLPLLHALFQSSKPAKPVIRLNGWSEEQTVFVDSVFLEGEARAETDIVDLTVNDAPVLRRAGRAVFFNHCVSLKEGKNIIAVKAVDGNGNCAESVISVIRRIPQVFQLDSRFSVAILPFENQGIVSGLDAMFYNLFLTQVMDRNRFRIIGREKLDVILQEQKLSGTKLVDAASRLESGKLEAAQATMIGNFIESSKGIEAVARIVDNETSEVLAVKDVYDEYKDPASMINLARGLAIKFHHEFPVVDGWIVQTDGKTVVSDLGQGKVKPRRRVVIYREKEPVRHPVSGQWLGCDAEILGYGRVIQVMDQMSRASLVRGTAGMEIHARDRIMSQ